ncbi:hypothetical protein FML64_07900 [Klebsiella quasipneumoniae]|uniref:Uncharacterized protein n=1 Tax=Klebsiella quasipneumoniae TaxID=1463165 RepID=A0AAI8IRW3_9ENTR|nr:hypothetical protein DKC11_28310 [Klebsiella quasipneumoniae]AWX87850.1 hypothetical protein DP204_15210 [Klebsiella quasipneumoniae subsp. quasipneumoniae]MDT1894301.1 hypothetical protein [Acinetobacter baumannii]OVX08429.1 hypothetical protein BME39_25485 [Klebsiella quasipneumoniae subsp. similipneumoniae]AWL61138.1 hypothetical protein DKC00_04875 [Klebsiella quasipneumoniae]
MSEIINDTVSPASKTELAGVWQVALKQKLNSDERSPRRDTGWQLCFNRSQTFTHWSNVSQWAPFGFYLC